MKQILTIMKRLLLFLLLGFVTMGCPGQGISELEWLRNQQAVERATILDGLILSLSFEDTGSTLTDDLGLNDGTSYNTTIETGPNGSALGYTDFAASKSYSEIPYDASLTFTDEITLMVDYYPTTVGGSGTSNIMGLFNAETGNHVYNIGHAPNGTVRFRLTLGTTLNVNSTETLALNEWNRIICRWTTGEGFRIIIDNGTEFVGAAQSGTSGSTTMPFNVSMNSSWVGASARMINGRVDNAMVWDRKLTDAEVTQMFTGNPSYAELVN